MSPGSRTSRRRPALALLALLLPLAALLAAAAAGGRPRAQVAPHWPPPALTPPVTRLSDPASEQIVLTIAQPYANHNGGQIVFGPDGYFYIGMGDGGSANDPQNRAQNPNVLLGKMLRIDPETGQPATYTVPPSNPFVGQSA